MKMPYKIECTYSGATHCTIKERTYSTVVAAAQCYIRTHSTKDRRKEWRYSITNTDTGKTWRGRA